MDIKIGSKVMVRLKKKQYHIGIYLGMNELGAALVGVLETSVPGITLKPGKKYISIFHAKKELIEVVS